MWGAGEYGQRPSSTTTYGAEECALARPDGHWEQTWIRLTERKASLTAVAALAQLWPQRPVIEGSKGARRWAPERRMVG